MDNLLRAVLLGGLTQGEDIAGHSRDAAWRQKPMSRRERRRFLVSIPAKLRPSDTSGR